MTLSKTQRVELVSYRQEFETELHNIMEYWIRYSQDENTKGFHGAVDINNQTVPDAPRSCVLTARILWTFAAAEIDFPGRSYDQMAHRAYAMLKDHFQDSEHKGFYMDIDSELNPINTIKHTYAQAFVLYALAKYYEMTSYQEVLDLIQDFFGFLDNKAKDPDGPGYLEGFSKEWMLIEQNRMADDNDPKSMNTHLHLLEAYAAVYKVWPDDKVKTRLKELLLLFENSIIRRCCHLGIFFDKNFKETNSSREICSFGHDIEASWLILEAIDILGDWEMKDRLEATLIQMANNIYRLGMDQDGGLFLESTRNGSHVRTNKHWWLQAEMLVGEMNSFTQTGSEKYWKLLKRTWRFIDRHVIDHDKGEWFTKVNRIGIPYYTEPADDPSPYYRNDWKIDPWKCPYHNGRAMLELIERIDKLLKK